MFCTNRDFSHLSTSKKISSNVQLAKENKTFMEAAAGIHYLAPIPEGKKIENPTRGCKQGKSNVTFVDTVKTAQSFVFIHASVFAIKTLGCQSIKSKSPLK